MLREKEAVLVVIDVQDRLLPFIHESETLLGQIEKLILGFRILQAPILVTEQYRKGLGPTHERIIEALTRGETAGPQKLSPREFSPIEKMSFSCGAHPPFMEALERMGRRQVVLCGIESHVCVLQTAIELRRAGYEVYLAADAVSSRSPRNVEIAWKRMEQEGVVFTSVEMAVFEMLQVCGTDPFRGWSRVIR